MCACIMKEDQYVRIYSTDINIPQRLYIEATD